ncbi:MAG: hypothetical protein R3A10_20330 [Caldilineaceae bacterium]
MGNRSNYEVCTDRRHTLETLTWRMEGQGRFLDDIVNGIWCICEESSWCLLRTSACSVGQSHPTAGLIATRFVSRASVKVGHDRLDEVSPLVRPRMEREIQQRVLIPCMVRDDFWWMGLEIPNRGNRRANNWNPRI